jgi:hypothetical protein
MTPGGKTSVKRTELADKKWFSETGTANLSTTISLAYD